MEINVLYDDKYLGPGLLIVYTLNDEIVKFLKICEYGEYGFPNFFVRGYEKDSIDKCDQKFREIVFSFNKESKLYEIMCEFSKSLNGNIMYSTDSLEQGKNNLRVEKNDSSVSLIMAKDVYKVRGVTNFINILLGDYYTCENYQAILKFYQDLSLFATRKSSDKDIKKLLLTI